MNKSITYGSPTVDMMAARSSVEHALGISLAAHESSYRGGDYFRFDHGDTEIILQQNFMDDDGEFFEAEFPDARVILYIDAEAEAADEMAALASSSLPQFQLLRQKSWQPRGSATHVER